MSYNQVIAAICLFFLTGLFLADSVAYATGGTVCTYEGEEIRSGCAPCVSSGYHVSVSITFDGQLPASATTDVTALTGFSYTIGDAVNEWSSPETNLCVAEITTNAGGDVTQWNIWAQTPSAPQVGQRTTGMGTYYLRDDVWVDQIVTAEGDPNECEVTAGWGCNGTTGESYCGQPSAKSLTCVYDPLLVELLGLRAISSHKGTTVEWETASEIDTAGYNIWRSVKEDGAYEKITDALIPAEGSPTQGASYQFVDENVEPGKTYHYKLEDVDVAGASTFHGPVSATVPAAIPTMTETGLIVAGAAFLITSIISLRRRRREFKYGS